MDMKKLLMILAFTLPLMAQEVEVEVKETVGKKVVRIVQDAEWSKSKSAHQRDHDKKGGMKRGGMEQRSKRMMMAKRKKMAKKRAFRSAVRIVVIGGIAYYIGLEQGKKHRKDGKGMKRRMGDKK